MNKKAQKQQAGIIILIIAIAAVAAFVYFKPFSFSILPAGQYRANTACSFLTNVPAGESYQQTGAWISVNDGAGMRGFGYGGYSTYACTSGATILQVTTPEGYTICTREGYSNRVYVVVGTNGLIFDTTKPGASDAILKCGSTPTCTPSWSCGAWSACSAGVQTRTCTDSNNCGTNTNKPATSQSCTSTPSGTCLIYDTSGTGKMTRADLGTAINKWITGT